MTSPSRSISGSQPKRVERRVRRRGGRTFRRSQFERLECRRLLATFVVDSFSDAVDVDPGDGVCAALGGGCTLRAAIQETNALANVGAPDEIQLPAGTFRLEIAGLDDQQAMSGDLDLTDDISIVGGGAANTVIDGNGLDRVFDIVRGAVTIRGVTIRGGLLVDDDDPVEGSGGGIRNEDQLTLIDSLLTGNVAPFGAGLANYNGTVTVQRSTISGNGDLTTTRGGGIANSSNYDAATIEISETTISDNRADDGGGLHNDAVDGRAELTILRSTVSGNTAAQGAGASNQSSLYLEASSTAVLSIQQSTVSGNTAENSGGGISNGAAVDALATTDVRGSTIAGNSAVNGDGGGLFSEPTDGATIHLESTIAADNVAGAVGPDLAGNNVTARFSLIENAAGHPITDGANNNLVGADPQLGALADNGGLTLTHAPSESSPAVDQGTSPAAVGADQRGSAFARTVDNLLIENASDGTDIGAVEIGQMAATLDFGDAPESILVDGQLRQYPTRTANDGARHRVVADAPFLGESPPDVEVEGQPSAAATGDDLLGNDDEDGLGELTLQAGMPLSNVVVAHAGGENGAFLNAWLDLNLDGDWDDFGEQIATDLSVPAGASTTSLEGVILPASTPAGITFLRTRISTIGGLSPRGEAIDGEVEDTLVTIVPSAPGDADLSLTLSVDEPNARPGSEITFTLIVRNDGPDNAGNVEITDRLPTGLGFRSASVTDGSFDSPSGRWTISQLAAQASAVLTITATVDSTDTLIHTAEVTGTNATDPDSTPDNDVEGEDDQASIAVGTCLTGPLSVGANQLTFSCASPGAFVAFIRGPSRGSHTFDRYAQTVDISNAEPIAIAAADRQGRATTTVELTESELSQAPVFQAFVIAPGRVISNTLSTNTPPLPATPSTPTSLSALDVSQDGNVTARDALMIVNHLTAMRATGERGSGAGPQETSRFDVNRDSRVTALDALGVVNGLRELRGAAESVRSMADPGRRDDDSEQPDAAWERFDQAISGLF